MTLQRNQYTPFILHYSHKIIVKWAVTQLAPIVAPYYRGGHRLVTAAGLQRAPTYWRCAHLLRDGGKSSILDGFFFWSAGLTEGNTPTWEIISLLAIPPRIVFPFQPGAPLQSELTPRQSIIRLAAGSLLTTGPAVHALLLIKTNRHRSNITKHKIGK